jgi:DNA-binding GntR family transcriptional regulator
MTQPSQTAALYERLRSSVLSLEITPGERLSERTLEAEFGASRTPVRAALMRLENEGLVARDGRAWHVTPIDLDEIAAIGEFREGVEQAAVRLTCERAADADLAALKESLSAFPPAGDEEEGVRRGADFHGELAALSGNRFFADAVRGSMTRLARTRWLEVRTDASRRQAWSEHTAIVDAVLARDADAAAHALVHHSRSTHERLLASLRADRRALGAHGLRIVGA